MTAAFAKAVSGKPFAFSSGIPGLGTASATQVTFTSDSAATVAAGANVAMTSVRFGSCIFTATECSPACPADLVVGRAITIDPCSLRLDTGAGTAVLQLGASTSRATQIGKIEVQCVSVTCTVTIDGMTISVEPPTGNPGG